MSTRKNGRSKTRSADKNCYCKDKRKLDQCELFCSNCETWFHQSCLKDLPNFFGLKFMVCYVFTCKNCSPTNHETWVVKQTHFSHMLITALANMMADRQQAGNSSRMFSMKKEVIPYFEKNWELLTAQQRRVKNTWHQALQRVAQKETEIFTCKGGENDGDDVEVRLNEADLSKLGPNHEFLKVLNRRPQSSGVQDAAPVEAKSAEVSSAMDGPKTRGAKRKAETQVTSTATVKKSKTTTDYTSTKVNGSGLVVDHPFNRDDYRYYLVEEDDHAPFRKEWHDQDDDATAGKPIPAFMYRLVRPSAVELSSHDRAPQLRLSDDHMTVTGEKGYCMIRCTHGVTQGTWYFEATFVDQPQGSHSRLGWAQELGRTQAPCGYDKFSYSWRSRKGTKFHHSHGKHYSDGYGQGDTVGFLIHLPPQTPGVVALPGSKKNLPLVKFKNHYYYEEKDEPIQVAKTLKTLPASKIVFFKNGVSQGTAFENIFGGTYYPAISLYKSAMVRVNFGPTFKFPPKWPGVKPMSDRAENTHVEQSLSDILYFVEHEGSLDVHGGNR